MISSLAPADLHHQLGLSLFDRGQYRASLESHRLAAQIDPAHAEANLRTGMLLWFQNDLEGALSYLERAVHLAPENGTAWAWRGLAWYGLGTLDRAVEACDAAILLEADNVDAHVFRGLVLHALGRTQEAVACYERALALDPECAHAHVFLAETLLLEGDYARGWREYEWRLRSHWWRRTSVAGPRWDGSPLHGRTLLVRAEQGFGDTVQYLRFVLPLIGQGHDVVVEVQPQLLSLLRQIPALRDRVFALGELRGLFDVHAELLSLPHLLGLQSVPPSDRYLHCDPVALPRTSFNVGLAWQGSPRQRLDRHRSIPLRTLLPLTACGARFYSLQYGTGSEQLDGTMPIAPAPSRFGFAEAASLIAGLDLVITIDSAVVHLAGAAGVPTWLLLPFTPDARWLRDRQDTAWYPHVRLFRQQSPSAWEGVVDAVRARLAEEVDRFTRLNPSEPAGESAAPRLREKEEGGIYAHH